jgi:uncharacterized Zn finger protein
MNAHPAMSLPILDDVLVEIACPSCGATGDVYEDAGDGPLPLCECRECGLVWMEEGA